MPINNTKKLSDISIIIIGASLVFLLEISAYLITKNTQKRNLTGIKLVIKKDLKYQYLLLQMNNAINDRMLIINDINLSTDPFDIDELKLEFNALATKFVIARDQLIALKLPPQQAKQLDKVKTTLNTMRGKLDIVINAKTLNNDTIYKDIIIEARASNQSVIGQISILINNQITAAENHLEALSKESKQSNNKTNFINLVALVLSLLIVIYIIKTLVKRRKQLKKAMGKLEFYNKDLEKTIDRRTEELMQLQKEHLRINAEINVNRQLQKFIAPAPKELKQYKELDIATYIESAEEVGGDYIDVLPCHGGQLICIGDVTEHGLESGIVMLMIQSMIRHQSNLSCQNLTQVLNEINISLFQNIQRMNGDRHLSLSLLYLNKNKLIITGQHETIIIIKANGKLELISTDELGFHVGFIDDIKPFTQSIELNIEKDDLVLLHTDGITEAANASEELYGFERLKNLAKTHHKKASEEITQIIITDLSNFIGSKPLYDDVALIVFKKT